MRTDPTCAKHKGISVLIIDIDTPGVEVRPLRQISGAAEFAEVFFTDAVVPADRTWSATLNDGWRITMGSLAHERGGLWVEGVIAALSGRVDDLVAPGRAPRASTATRSCAADSAELATQRAASLRALGYKGFASFAQGIVGARAQLHEAGDHASCARSCSSSAIGPAGRRPAPCSTRRSPQRRRPLAKSWMTSLAVARSAAGPPRSSAT